jgi:16S rRNA G1207 methylase RsmC
MSDVDTNTIALSKANALLNDVQNIQIIKSDEFIDFKETGFDMILCNPPHCCKGLKSIWHILDVKLTRPKRK